MDIICIELKNLKQKVRKERSRERCWFGLVLKYVFTE